MGTETYSFLRTLADSWMLLVLVLIFVGVVIFVFRPGSRRAQRDAAESIFQNENRPAPTEQDRSHPGQNPSQDKGDL